MQDPSPDPLLVSSKTVTTQWLSLGEPDELDRLRSTTARILIVASAALQGHARPSKGAPSRRNLFQFDQDQSKPKTLIVTNSRSARPDPCHCKAIKKDQHRFFRSFYLQLPHLCSLLTSADVGSTTSTTDRKQAKRRTPSGHPRVHRAHDCRPVQITELKTSVSTWFLDPAYLLQTQIRRHRPIPAGHFRSKEDQRPHPMHPWRGVGKLTTYHI